MSDRSELEALLGQARAGGEDQGEGCFTLASRLALPKLAASSPFYLQNAYAVLAHLVSGLMEGLELAWPAPRWITYGSKLNPAVGLRLEFSLKGSPNAGSFESVASLLPALRRIGELPFQGDEPWTILLSRARVAFLKLGIACRFALGDRVEMWELLEPEEDISTLAGPTVPSPDALVVVLSNHPSWPAWIGGMRRSEYATRASLRKAVLTSGPLARAQDWKDKEVGVAVLDSFGAWYTGGWWDYRAPGKVLLESFHAGPRETPFRVPTSLQGSPGHHAMVRRPGGAFLDRWRNRPNTLFRGWGMETTQRVEEQIPVRAVFVIGLHERQSMVRYFNWGRVHKDQPLGECPPGLRAWVWWPALKQDLYGVSWVEDAQLAMAQEWTRGVALSCFDFLRGELDAVRAFVHSRTARGAEVDARLSHWPGPQP